VSATLTQLQQMSRKVGSRRCRISVTRPTGRARWTQRRTSDWCRGSPVGSPP